MELIWQQRGDWTVEGVHGHIYTKGLTTIALLLAKVCLEGVLQPKGTTNAPPGTRVAITSVRARIVTH